MEPPKQPSTSTPSDTQPRPADAQAKPADTHAPVTKAHENEVDFEKFYSLYRKQLKGAEQGKVVTRFAPEPSGYLHIGHVKAACVSYHYARMFGGKMILRFDDTNPAKEKEEFTESIEEDLRKLDISWDRITYTSDSFQLLIDVCTQAIKDGLAYCDDTAEDQMKKERTDGIESKRRNTTPEENLHIWSDMIAGGSKTYCVRAKIDYKCPNKCMRDPVIFRHVDTPHARTGNKFKVYPTYDFACPIVDANEGVTHAMRSNEYADRNHQYNWFLEKLKLRKVLIHDYSRLNFVSTTLSKRKLNWFVDGKMVDGWDDPRFPTVRGILRHGMMKSALLEFILEQGPSKNANLMEWDKIWAINRKHIDPLSLKLYAISKAGAAEVTISNFTGHDDVSLVPFHPKNEALGEKPVFKTGSILVEVEDLQGLKVGDKILPMKYGVCTITEISADNRKATVTVDFKDTNFKDPKKVHWLPNKKELLCTVNVIEYDHLLSVKKPDDEKDFTQVVNPKSKFVTEFLAEGVLKTLPPRTHIQFERRGYFVIDKKQVIADKEHIDAIFIPDGKTKSMSGLSTNVDAKKISKGE